MQKKVDQKPIEEEEDPEEKKEREEAQLMESQTGPSNGKASRGTEAFIPTDPQSNLIFMWGCSRGNDSEPDRTFLSQFANELNFIYDRTNLSVTFPNMLVDMLVDTNQKWELRTTNLVQKC